MLLLWDILITNAPVCFAVRSAVRCLVPVSVVIMLDEGKEKIKNHYVKDGFVDYILKNNLKEEVNKIIKKML